MSPIHNIQNTLIDSLNTAVLILDRDLHLISINPAGEMLFATSARLALNIAFERLLLDSTDFIEALQHALSDRHPYTEREIQLKLHNGQNLTIDCTVTPVDDDDSCPAGLLLEMTQVDRQLRIAREENLLTQNHTVRMLVRGMAHEIKNPLSGLRGAAQLLERELNDITLKEYTQVIIDEADRLQNLLNRMLGPNTPPRMQQINIHTVLERVYTLAQAEVSDDITIIRDYDPSIPEVTADPELLIQAILNIIRNAIHAVGEQGQIIIRSRTQRQVTIGQHRYRLAVRIDIIDDGPGIPATISDTIFYPMVTGNPEGTGLGLPISQSLINQHGGLIECSRQSQDTVFTIFLPLESHHESFN
jgi:two-component system nitrogen regulation sensor histidine kinase GlnL